MIFLYIHLCGTFYLGSKFQISFFDFFFRKVNIFGVFLFLEFDCPTPPNPTAGDVHPLPLPPPVYHNFCEATQSALFRASAPCPFLILAGALRPLYANMDLEVGGLNPTISRVLCP